MVQKCDSANVTTSAEEKMGANPCWWKMIENGLPRALLMSPNAINSFNMVTQM